MRRSPRVGVDRASRTATHAIVATMRNMSWRSNDAPIVKIGNASKEGFLEKKTKRQEKFVLGARKWCVGPMPVDEFLQAFFPTSQEGQRMLWKGKGKKSGEEG